VTWVSRLARHLWALDARTFGGSPLILLVNLSIILIITSDLVGWRLPQLLAGACAVVLIVYLVPLSLLVARDGVRALRRRRAASRTG
jgi:hypothetical protein